MPSKHSPVWAENFTEDSFEQNLAVRSLLGPSFNLSSTCNQERRGTDDF